MRYLIALALGIAIAGPALTQPPPKEETGPPVRFGYPYRDKAFPQATPKQALDSVALALEKGDVIYLVSNLLDPAFVDAQLNERTRQLEPIVESELILLRSSQKRNLDRVAPDARVPDNPVRLRALANEKAKERAFKLLVHDVREKLLDDPETHKLLRRFARQGAFPADDGAGTTARVGLAGIKDRAVFLRKVNDRWFIENKQFDSGAATPAVPKAPVEMKP